MMLPNFLFLAQVEWLRVLNKLGAVTAVGASLESTSRSGVLSIVPSWLKAVDVPSKGSSKLIQKKATSAVAATAVRNAELLSSLAQPSPAQPSPLHQCRCVR